MDSKATPRYTNLPANSWNKPMIDGRWRNLYLDANFCNSSSPGRNSLCFEAGTPSSYLVVSSRTPVRRVANRPKAGISYRNRSTVARRSYVRRLGHCSAVRALTVEKSLKNIGRMVCIPLPVAREPVTRQHERQESEFHRG